MVEFNKTIKNFEEYKKYLKSNEWYESKKYVLFNNKGKRVKCHICFTRSAISAHHVSYKYLGEPEESCDLVPVCDCCHKIIHGKKPKIILDHFEEEYIRDRIKNIKKVISLNLHRSADLGLSSLEENI